MKRPGIVSLALLFALSFPATGPGAPFPSSGEGEVFFSPDGGATTAIVREIEGAEKEVLLQAFSFTSSPIAEAAAGARKRGLKVEAVLDKSNRTARYSVASYLRNHGIPVFIDGKHSIAHNKVIIIDRRTVITGSFNFTRAAEESNAENLLILKGNPGLTELYMVDYEAHKSHSQKY